MAKEIILKDEDGGQLLPVTTTEQVKRGGAGKTLEDSMLEFENLVPLAKAYNVNYNRETGYFEYAGLTDLTADNVMDMIAETSMYACGEDIDWKYAYCRSRVNLLPKFKRTNVFTIWNKYVSGIRSFYYSQFEVIQLCSDYYDELFGISISNCESMFSNSNNLRKIIGRLRIKEDARIIDMFNNCKSLVDLTIHDLHSNISFNDSPLLSYNSIKYLVDNAANTSAITVTVHADVYAKLAGTATDYGDNTKKEWMAVMASATDKNISFATE